MSCKNIKINVVENDYGLNMDITDNIEKIEIDIDSPVEINTTVLNSDYETLKNKPAINNIELWKHTKLSDIGVEETTNTDIENLFK